MNPRIKFCEILGILFRYYAYPPLWDPDKKENPFTEATRSIEPNIEGLKRVAEGVMIIVSQPPYCREIPAEYLLRDPYVQECLSTKEGWGVFGQSFRLGAWPHRSPYFIRQLPEYFDICPVARAIMP